MPHVTVKLYPGKTDEQKTHIADAIVAAVMASAGVPEAALSVAIVDVPEADWAATVYHPEIVGQPDVLVRKPGYTLP